MSVARIRRKYFAVIRYERCCERLGAPIMLSSGNRIVHVWHNQRKNKGTPWSL